VAFTRWRVAVFVDGVFWHDHPDHFDPARASDYWRGKIARNQERDRTADAALVEAGWTVLRFWDQDVKADATACVEKVLGALADMGWAGRA
jgi:DNA mismatch endonuclease (patch repair protein)